LSIFLWQYMLWVFRNNQTKDSFWQFCSRFSIHEWRYYWIQYEYKTKPDKTYFRLYIQAWYIVNLSNLLWITRYFAGFTNIRYVSMSP
jgi:hypothetical protein